MYENCITVHEVASLLRRRYQLPVQMFAGHLLISSDSDIGGVRMPAAVGRKVAEAVVRQKLHAPILSNPRATYYTLLCSPEALSTSRCAQADRLAPAEVELLPEGTRIWLPRADHGAEWRWIVEPLGRTRSSLLPSGEVFDLIERQLPWAVSSISGPPIGSVRAGQSDE